MNFSSHRFILVSFVLFHAELLGWPNKSDLARADLDQPTILPFSFLQPLISPLVSYTLVFSHRSYDLSTASAILPAALYLDLPTLHDQIHAQRIARNGAWSVTCIHNV
jgi:hypothetical protein